MKFIDNKCVYEYSDEGCRALQALPKDDIHKKYRFEVVENVRQPGQGEHTWSGIEVKIYHTGDDTLVYQYFRDYPSLLETCDTFRWWHNDLGVWKDYAVISPSYLGFEIIDLENGSKIAETSEEDIDAFSFCPTGFYIPDFWDVQDTAEFEVDSSKEKPEIGYYQECMTTFLKKRSFGFVSGTVWGDDWAWKLAQLDLCDMLEGKAAIVQKFGYYPLPWGIALRDTVGSGEYFTDNENDNLDLVTFNTIRLHSDGSLGEIFVLAKMPNNSKTETDDENKTSEQS